MEYLMTKGQVLAHTDHQIQFTADASIVCNTCGVVVWSQDAVNEKSRRVSKEFYARLRVEDPDRYREINREKGRARRARMKADPVLHERYRAKTKEYNDRARAKREANGS